MPDHRYYSTTPIDFPLPYQPGCHGPRLTAAMLVESVFPPGSSLAIDGLSTLGDIAKALGGQYDSARQAWFWPDGTGVGANNGATYERHAPREAKSAPQLSPAEAASAFLDPAFPNNRLVFCQDAGEDMAAGYQPGEIFEHKETRWEVYQVGASGYIHANLA